MSRIRQNTPGKSLHPFAELGNAVVKQAAKDYRTARRIQERNPNGRVAEGEIRSIRRFFYSDYFMLWTDLDGPALFERLEKMIDEELER